MEKMKRRHPALETSLNKSVIIETEMAITSFINFLRLTRYCKDYYLTKDIPLILVLINPASSFVRVVEGKYGFPCSNKAQKLSFQFIRRNKHQNLNHFNIHRALVTSTAIIQSALYIST